MKTIAKTILGGILVGLFLFTSSENVSAKNAKLYVDAAANPGGDGGKHAPFRRITDAVNAARAIWLADTKAKTKIEIHVEPGTYVGSYSNTGPDIEVLPIKLDIPGLNIEGSTSMLMDEDDLPTGSFKSGTESLIKAEPPLAVNQSLLLITPTNSSLTGQGVAVSKFSFNVGNAPTANLGSDIFVERVQDFTISDNYVTGGAFSGIETRAASGKIRGNHITRVGCGTCIVAGSNSSPANVIFSGNRSVNNFFGGVALLGGGITDASTDRLWAVVEGNDLSDSNTNPTAGQGFGIRVMVVRHDPPDLGPTGNVTATISNNRISNNKLGVSIDAGFPYRTVMGSADPRLHNGTLNLSLVGNEVVANLMAPALISFTRNTATLTPGQLTTQWKYLERSTFDITDPDGNLNGYWFDHPVTDPVDGRTLQNTLRINGAVIPNGRYVPFP